MLRGPALAVAGAVLGAGIVAAALRARRWWSRRAEAPAGTRPERTGAGEGRTAGAGDVRAAIVRRLDQIRGADPGTDTLLRRLVTSFLDRTPARLDHLAEALADGDATAVAAQAHGLQGSAANLGAEEMAFRCAEVDALGRAGRLEPVADQLPALRAAYVDVERVMRTLLAGWEPADPERPHPW